MVCLIQLMWRVSNIYIYIIIMCIMIVVSYMKIHLALYKLAGVGDPTQSFPPIDPW